jgi:aminomuconate-semialdehyde/2-hydroxymuconate-6-semialdehyde dehydrogenase
MREATAAMGMGDVRLFIDGAYVDGGGDRFLNTNPATGEPVGRVHEATADDVDRAVTAARRSLAGPWGKMSAEERARLLERVADGIDARKDAFLKAEIDDTGKPVSMASVIDIPRGAANFRIFAQIAREMSQAEVFHTPTPDGQGAMNYVVRSPVGVVAVICPWNLPLLLMTWKVAPALAAGNTVVVKPSEETPATATLLGEVMKDAGVPDGVYNVVHGFGPGSAGQFLVEHDGVNAITFTGESATGSAIMKNAADKVKPVSFELGGKNPAVIFEDADVDKALDGTVRSVFSNCGQVCLCSERVYVHRSLFDRFVEGLVTRARALKLGDPWRESTTTGPLISDEHRQKVLGYYKLAADEGGEILLGGDVPRLDGTLSSGSWIDPTVVVGLSDDARFCREEIFGPACHIAPFDDEDEVIARANDTPYGLCAAVWTENLSRAHRVAPQLDVGITWVNTWYLRDLRTPFGGTKLSGIGREGGRYSMEFYSELKNICVKL